MVGGDDDDQLNKLIAHTKDTDKLVINPDHTFKSLWDAIGFLFIMYQAMIVPFRISFEVDSTGFLGYVETGMDIYFMMDLFISFNTGYDVKGLLIMKRKLIILNYLKSWFVLDLLASFPYSWVF